MGDEVIIPLPKEFMFGVVTRPFADMPLFRRGGATPLSLTLFDNNIIIFIFSIAPFQRIKFQITIIYINISPYINGLPMLDSERCS